MRKNRNSEAREFLPRIIADIDQRFLITSFFLLAMLILKLGFKIPLPNSLFYLVSLLSLIAIPVTVVLEKTRARTPRLAINFYFFFLLFDLILITAIIYFVGGITWIMPGIYLLYAVNAFWLFPPRQAIFSVIYTSSLLVSLVVLQYFRILSHPAIFLPEAKSPQNFPYFLTTIIVALVILGFLGHTADIFYRLLQRKIKELRQTRKKLEETKKFLVAEVEKRTKELKAEKKRLEKAIKARTKELEEKRETLKGRVKKLSDFHKKAVTRELEMAKIKEEITRLKGLELNK